MPAVIGKIVPGRTDRERGSAAGSPLRQGRVVGPGGPGHPRRAAPVTASRERFLESNLGGTTEAMLSSQCGTEAYFFVGAGALDGPRENGIPLSPLCGQRRLAVPEKRCGLTLFLAFFDRCGNSVFALSATGSAKPQFPLGRGAQKEREPLRPSVSTGAPPLRQGRQK